MSLTKHIHSCTSLRHFPALLTLFSFRHIFLKHLTGYSDKSRGTHVCCRWNSSWWFPVRSPPAPRERAWSLRRCRKQIHQPLHMEWVSQWHLIAPRFSTMIFISSLDFQPHQRDTITYAKKIRYVFYILLYMFWMAVLIFYDRTDIHTLIQTVLSESVYI